MTSDEILRHIERALIVVAPTLRDRVGPLRIVADLDALGLDSITTLELVSHLEEHLGIAFTDDQLLDMRSGSDLVAIIQELTATPTQNSDDGATGA